MFNHLIVPVDGSLASFAAVPVAARMARAVGGNVEVVTVVDRLADVALARDALDLDLVDLANVAVPLERRVLTGDSVAGVIARHVAETPGAMVAMSSHGHGRSAAVLGSTCDAMLREMYGPVIVIGPNLEDDSGRLDGPYVVPLDGSKMADDVLPIVAAYRKYYGTSFALRITALMFVTIVAAALIVDALFSAFGLIPETRPTKSDIFGSIELDYKLVLNLIASAAFAALFVMTMRRGVTDPVCGMKVDRAKALRLEHAGQIYHFCSEHCRSRFEGSRG